MFTTLGRLEAKRFTVERSAGRRASRVGDEGAGLLTGGLPDHDPSNAGMQSREGKG